MIACSSGSAWATTYHYDVIALIRSRNRTRFDWIAPLLHDDPCQPMEAPVFNIDHLIDHLRAYLMLHE